MAGNESLFEKFRDHEFMGGPGFDGLGLGSLLGRLMMGEALGDDDCPCPTCTARRGEKKSEKKNSVHVQKKSLEHILADASVKGIQAHGEAKVKYLFESMQEFQAENAELIKKHEKLKEQLNEREDIYAAEIERQSEEFRDALANFRKKVESNESQAARMQNAITVAEEKKTQMQKSIDGKVHALKQGADAAKKLEEEKDVLQTALNTIAGFVEESKKDLRKPELKTLVENVGEAVKVTEGLMKTLSSK
ncbi:MAG: hypothetical protein ACKUBY_04035 [Candidatus Moraniibacteriota bacterium]